MLRRFRNWVLSSLRYKLLALTLFPVLLVMPVVIALAYLWSNEVSYRQLLMKVNTDLSVAHDAFVNTQNQYLTQLALAAQSYSFRTLFNALDSDSMAAYQLQRKLGEVQQTVGFDFLDLYSPNGCRLLAQSHCRMTGGPLLERALAGEPAVGVEVFTAQELSDIDPALAQRVYLPLQRTPYAAPSPRRVEDRGMLLRVIYPLRDNGGQITALAAGGVLLNGNFDFVDRLRDLVYGSGSLSEDSLGTVTVFLDDVRISTNVPRRLNDLRERALGTRVSMEVRDRVLGQGESWIDRAFVVSEWYISAYEPILDTQGKRVGMLYTGFLEAPFKAAYFQALKWLLVLFLAVTLVCVVLAVIGARSIFSPIEAMARVMRNIGYGLDQRIGRLDSRDEIGELARQFDAMLDQLQAQRQQIESSAVELELKVEQRTTELRQRTIELQRHIDLLNSTRQQLVAKEKLAAIGQLTAGIAHEINNPTAVILGYMDLLVAELGQHAEPVSEEVQLIIQQVYRIRELINNLLQYSRPGDYLNAVDRVDLNRVVRDSLVLVRHDLDKQGVRVALDLRARAGIGGNHQQFQQVLINLMVNAVNAMSEKGELTIRTRDWGDDGVLLVVRDTGRGIAPKDLPRIFDPFFTRCQGGTGLGLSVTYSILQRYDAEIRVRSRVGVGTSFFIWFKSEPVIDDSEQALIGSLP